MLWRSPALRPSKRTTVTPKPTFLGRKKIRAMRRGGVGERRVGAARPSRRWLETSYSSLIRSRLWAAFFVAVGEDNSRTLEAYEEERKVPTFKHLVLSTLAFRHP